MENDVDMNDVNEWQELPSVLDVSPPPLNVNQEIPIPQEDLPLPVARQWRLNATNIFCTWPQCDTPKETALTRAMAIPGIEWAVVCREDHHETDGTHLHAILHFKKKKNFKSAKSFDGIAGKPGHYESARNLKLSVIYVIKDGDYSSEGIDIAKFCEEKKSAKSAIIADMIKKDTPMSEIIDKEAGFYMLHSNQIRSFAAEWAAMKNALTLSGYKEVMFSVRMTEADKKIGIWLNSNMRMEIRGLGTKQLFIFGKTALGKSHLCQQLSKMVKTYFATSCEHFFDGLDETYDLIIMDEFHGQQTVTFMNQLLDGQCMVIPQKGRQYHKHKNVPIIICSNYAPKDCYHKVYDENRDHYDAFERRLEVVEVTTRINLWQPTLERENAFLL